MAAVLYLCKQRWVMRGDGRLASAALWMLMAPTMARACTVCDSATGHAVRRGVFDGHFALTAAETLLPFPVFLLAVLAIFRWLPVRAGEA